VEAAGGVVPCGEGVEVSPLVSYAGEGLEELCAGRTFASAYDVTLQGVVQLAPKPNAAGRLLRGAAGGSAEYNSPRPAPKAAAPAGATIVANCSAFRSQQ
jgi:hypothetical protein